MEKENTAVKMAKEFLEDKLTQAVIGANKAHTIFGERGQEAYAKFMNGGDVIKARQDTYHRTKSQYAKMGVVGEPSYPTDADFSARTINQYKEFEALLPLGELEKIVGSIDKLGFKIPEKLRRFTLSELMKKAYDPIEQKLDEKKLTEDEKNAWQSFNLLSEAYKEMCAYKLVGQTYLAELNSAGKAIEEKYSPKKKD